MYDNNQLMVLELWRIQMTSRCSSSSWSSTHSQHGGLSSLAPRLIT